MAITNKDYLTALNNLVEKSSTKGDIFTLSDAQVEMLKMSEDDILNGRLISQQQLDDDDLEWLSQR